MNGDNTLGTFECPDILHPKRIRDDGNNEKDKGETEEKKGQDDEAGNSNNKGITELTSAFQSLKELEAYTTKYMANNKQAKEIIKF